MKRIQIILVILMACSCSLLKQHSKTTEQTFTNSTEETVAGSVLESTRKNAGEQIVYSQDSTDTDYAIHFWPKGKVDFSAEGGFAGEFDSIMITGRQKKMLKAKDVNRLNTVESDKIDTRFHTKENVKAGKKTVTRLKVPDARVILLVLILVTAIIVIWKFWKLKN